MTSIKDKLASSVRQAKTAGEPVPGDRAETHKTSSSVATKAAAAEPAPDDSPAAEPPSSLQELFPDRIWPD
jgi:hypothetical protein